MSDAIEDAVSGHLARNKALVARLVDLGVDLEKPRTIDLHFIAPSPSAALDLGRALRQAGHPEVKQSAPAAGEGRISVTSTVTAAVSEVTHRDYIDRHVRIAAMHGAIHDGWGTSVEPSGS